MGDQGVRDLVLHVARRDADHALVVRMLAQLLDVLLGEARQRLAVVQLELLQPRQPGVLGSSSRVRTAHMAAISIVCGAMCFP